MESGTRDSLTKFYKEKPFSEMLENEIHRGKRYNRPFSILIIELETTPAGGKKYSQYPVLKQCSKVIRDLIRQDDIPGRLGDKLVVAIPESGLENAKKMAERILGELGTIEFMEDGLVVHVSASIGIAVYPENGNSPSALIGAAEKALSSAPIKS